MFNNQLAQGSVKKVARKVLVAGMITLAVGGGVVGPMFVSGGNVPVAHAWCPDGPGPNPDPDDDNCSTPTATPTKVRP